MAKKAKKASVEMTLWGVVASYPDLHDPKPFKGKVYFKLDCLMDMDHPQLKKLKAAINQVRTEQWGEDKAEWPKGATRVFIQDGNEREDQKAYQDKYYISAKTQQPVPVVDPKGKPFNPQMLKGGMTVNVAIAISAWEFDGDEGVAIYLQGVQVDTSVPKLDGFGGGKSVEQMFGKSKAKDDESEELEEEEDDQPRSKKKAKKVEDEGEEVEDDEPAPKAKKKKAARNFDEDEE